MDLPFTHFSLNENFWQTVMDVSDRFRRSFSGKGVTVLSVSLINGRFRAMSIVNDTIDQSWERPGVIVNLALLQSAISDAIHHTQFPGTRISILVEDRRCLSLTLQLPAMPLTDLVPILERKAQQVKSCEEPAAWRYYLGIQGKGKQSVHLEIFPQSFIDEITQICEHLDLELQQLAPLSALSESQLSTLSIEPGEATILISMLEGKVTFIAGGEDGRLLLTRHLAPVQDWVPLGERVGTEVNRTIMFITQQANVHIPRIWFLGEEERLTLEEVQPHVSTPIFPCPIKPDWKYWLWIGATLPNNLSNNFTPLEVLRAPFKKLLTKTLAAAIIGFLIVSVGATGILEGYFAKNQERFQTAAAQALALRENQQQWVSRLVTIQTQQQWVQAITEKKFPSLEGPLLSYLGNVIPPQMILYKTVIKRTNDMWNLELAGRTSTNLPSTLLLIDKLARELAQGPYHVRVQEGWRDQLLNQTNSQALSEHSQPNYQWTLKGNLL
jgi:hypothetical protein